MDLRSRLERVFADRSELGSTKLPLIVILGATGSGKTKLSIELASKLGGEIISADSMQIYHGLDIATNKATREERSQVPHHLLDVVSPFKQFTVVDFQQSSLKAIEDIHARSLVPIIVGGTNYYIESILWDTLVSSEPPEALLEPSDASLPPIDSLEALVAHPFEARDLRNLSDSQLYEFLVQLDPQASKRVYQSDRRKVIRALQYFQQTGQKYSEKLMEQQQSNGTRHGGPLRYRDAIIFWLDCDKQILDNRLDARVDQMIASGLVEELEQFHQDYHKLCLTDGHTADYTEGIFQAIGFKEFHDYLLLSKEERKTYEGSVALGRAITLLKQRTRAYVNKQLKWINRRFLVDSNIRDVPSVYRLDSSQPEQWNELVNEPALQVIDHCLQAFYETTSEPDPIHLERLAQLAVKPKVTSIEEDQFVSGQFWCDKCEVHVSGGKSYQMHLCSKKHRGMNKDQQETAKRKRV